MKSFFQSKYAALKAIGATLWKAWHVWVFFLCALIPRWIPWLLTEIRVTRLGVAYEFLGVVVVATGIVSKTEVGNQNLRRNVIAWANELLGNFRYLILGPKIVNINMFATSKAKPSLTLAVIRGEFTLPNGTVEEQLKALADAYNGMKLLVTEVEKNAREKIASLETKIEEQGKTVTEQVKKTHIEFQKAIAGDYKMEFAGLFVTLLGMIYNSIPNDVIYLFKWWISL